MLGDFTVVFCRQSCRMHEPTKTSNFDYNFIFTVLNNFILYYWSYFYLNFNGFFHTPLLTPTTTDYKVLRQIKTVHSCTADTPRFFWSCRMRRRLWILYVWLEAARCQNRIKGNSSCFIKRLDTKHKKSICRHIYAKIRRKLMDWEYTFVFPHPTPVDVGREKLFLRVAASASYAPLAI